MHTIAICLEKKKRDIRVELGLTNRIEIYYPSKNRESQQPSVSWLYSWVTEKVNTQLMHNVNCGNMVEETYLCESCQLGLGRSYLKSLLPSTHLRGKFKKQDK